ncbi:cell division control protein 42 homolog [Watersipora subatra]|uniref:cell division control protein 42 homolog n=1 Tax=Watersipora subatra TaxID=2589382 RepID=UPI00355B2D42
MRHHTLVPQDSGRTMKLNLIGRNTPRKSHFRLVIVGDAKCGKTSLLRSHATRLAFPYNVNSGRPIASQYQVKQKMLGLEYTGTAIDTDSKDLKTRISAYSHADAIVLCFSLINKLSFKNLQEKWLKELELYCPNVPIVLVGTQSDLVHNPNTNQKDIVTWQRIQKHLMRQRVHIYCESSALTKDGLSNVYEEAMKAAWIGPVKYVMRMRTVRESAIDKLKALVLPCMFRKSKR